MVIGIILKTNNGFINEDILNLLDKVVLGSITLKDLVFIIIGVVIAVGCFTIVTSLFGGGGALFKIKVMLIIVSIDVIFSQIVGKLSYVMHGRRIPNEKWMRYGDTQKRPKSRNTVLKKALKKEKRNLVTSQRTREVYLTSMQHHDVYTVTKAKNKSIVIFD